MAADLNIRQLCHDIRNTRNAVAIHTRNKEDQQKLGAFKHQITIAARCRSADVSQKWEKILFRNIPFLFTDMNLQEVTITEQDVIREVGYHHSAPPTKVVIKPLSDNRGCNVLLYFNAGQLPPANLKIFGTTQGFITLKDKGKPKNCDNCNTFHPGLCRKAKTCGNCGKHPHPGTCSPRCPSCHSTEHASEDPKCPLRPKFISGQWHYPNR